LAGRPYAKLMNSVLASTKRGLDETLHPLLQKRTVKKVGVLLISTDKGLCGGLNTNLFREASHCESEITQFVSLGRKGTAFLSRMKRNLVADFEMKESPTLAYTKKVSSFLIESFLKGEIDQIDVIYTDYISVINQKPVRKQLVPILDLKGVQAGVHGSHTEAHHEEELGIEATFEPSAHEVLNSLLPHYIHFQVYQCYLEAKASEHSSRMVAMKNATDNAKQMIKDLTLEYNKVRQAGITKELLEITTAQMAMG
jgi:F-type H+-transporting ATPase subunit gamma